MMKLFFVILFSGLILAQSVHTKEDVQICQAKFHLADSLKISSKPINEVFVDIAKSFIGLGYEANTLQNENQEQLRIHLTGLDCYTFMEAALTFARTIKSGKNKFSDYEKEIEFLRYRDGKMTDYTSRLHYFSDWLFDIEKRNIINQISKKIGGVEYNKEINFMSTHPNSYKELKSNPDFVKKMSEIEKEISKRKYFYLNQNDIEKIEDKIKNGDIIGITTDIKGLDISHVGIAVKMNNGRIHFLHAPITGKKIQITEIPLAEYIKGNKRQTGIMVARILEMKN